MSHFVGACVFAGLAVVLLHRGQGNRLRMTSLGVMAVTTVQTLLLSSIYHTFWPGPMREFMLRADVAGIFLLIGGCLTPVHAILFQGSARWAPLILIWSAAIGGMVLRLLFFDHFSNAAGIVVFLVQGWGGAISAGMIWHKFGWQFVQNGVLAGLAYTVGAIVLVVQQPILVHGIIGPHEVWHLAVLTGLSLHWRFVFQFAAGLPTQAEATQWPPTIPFAPPHLAAAIRRRAAIEPLQADRRHDPGDGESRAA